MNNWPKARELAQSVTAVLSGEYAMLEEPEASVARVMQAASESLVALCDWISATLKGDATAERHLTAAKTRMLIALEGLPSEAFPAFSSASNAMAAELASLAAISGVKSVVGKMALIPVPVIATTVIDRTPPKRSNPEERTVVEIPKREPVIKVMLFVDGRPWSTPQVIEPGVVYDIKANITVVDWPPDTKLVLDHATTLTADQYSLVLPAIEASKSDVTQVEANGHVEFTSAQSALSEPISIKLLARFVDPSGNARLAAIVGYHELRVRVSSRARPSIQSKYPALDQRTQDLLAEVDQMQRPVEPQHRDDFIAALAAVTNFMGQSLQAAIFREGEVVSEGDFQRALLSHMRTFFGAEVKEAPKEGGGPTDIVYRSVVVELKVEKKLGQRDAIILKYVRQPVQYSSASGSRLSILCVLDLSSKKAPPANPQNNISLASPPVHGFEPGKEPYPSKVAVVIIDGNLRLPSDYSRSLR